MSQSHTESITFATQYKRLILGHRNKKLKTLRKTLVRAEIDTLASDTQTTTVTFEGRSNDVANALAKINGWLANATMNEKSPIKESNEIESKDSSEQKQSSMPTIAPLITDGPSSPPLPPPNTHMAMDEPSSIKSDAQTSNATSDDFESSISRLIDNVMNNYGSVPPATDKSTAASENIATHIPLSPTQFIAPNESSSQHGMDELQSYNHNPIDDKVKTTTNETETNHISTDPTSITQPLRSSSTADSNVITDESQTRASTTTIDADYSLMESVDAPIAGATDIASGVAAARREMHPQPSAKPQQQRNLHKSSSVDAMSAKQSEMKADDEMTHESTVTVDMDATDIDNLLDTTQLTAESQQLIAFEEERLQKELEENSLTQQELLAMDEDESAPSSQWDEPHQSSGGLVPPSTASPAQHSIDKSGSETQEFEVVNSDAIQDLTPPPEVQSKKSGGSSSNEESEEFFSPIAISSKTSSISKEAIEVIPPMTLSSDNDDDDDDEDRNEEKSSVMDEIPERSSSDIDDEDNCSMLSAECIDTPTFKAMGSVTQKEEIPEMCIDETDEILEIQLSSNVMIGVASVAAVIGIVGAYVVFNRISSANSQSKDKR